jgi:hypothetical protein
MMWPNPSLGVRSMSVRVMLAASLRSSTCVLRRAAVALTFTRSRRCGHSAQSVCPASPFCGGLAPAAALPRFAPCCSTVLPMSAPAGKLAHLALCWS